MKKIVFFTLITLSFIIVGCSKNDDIGEGNETPQESQISLNATTAEFTKEGGTAVVTCTTTDTWTATINSDGNEWCSISPTSGSAGVANITITTTANTTTDHRSAMVIIKSGIVEKTIKVSQSQKDAIVIAEDCYTIVGEGGEFEVEIKHNVEFDIQIDVDWITQKQTRSLESNVLTFVVSKNDTNEERSGSITLISKDGKISQSISITQDVAIITEIYYTSADDKIVIPNDTDWGGARIVSNIYTNGKGIITFEGKVTTIGEKAFYDCPSLTSITIPEYITSIGEQAFTGCYSLSAFYGKFASSDNRCLVVDNELKSFAPSNLNSYTISDEIKSIGNAVFFTCGSLENIEIPNGIISIGHTAFAGCISLKSINIPYGVTRINDNTFASCVRLEDVIIPASVTSIGMQAFDNCHALTNIEIPTSVSSIGDSAFSHCGELTKINIPEGVITIGQSAFSDCYSLTNITIPNSVTSIGINAFGGCKSLSAFYGKFVSNDNRCIIIDGELKWFARAGLTSYTIPDSVTSIGYRVFEGCTYIETINIPDSVTSIGVNAFAGCSSLTNITIPNSVTLILDAAFRSCEALTRISIPNSVELIGMMAFIMCNNLTEVYCKPITPPSLGEYAFDYNESNRKNTYLLHQ